MFGADCLPGQGLGGGAEMSQPPRKFVYRSEGTGRVEPQRKSRAGRERHRSGLCVRNVAPPADDDIEHAPPRRAPGISLPPVRFLEKKKIAGEWI